MTEKNDVFKCLKCKKIVTVLQAGEGDLVCCGEKMTNVTPDEGKKLIYDLQRPGTP